MHDVLPDLAYLEKKYDKQLVVIGVHSRSLPTKKNREHSPGHHAVRNLAPGESTTRK